MKKNGFGTGVIVTLLVIFLIFVIPILIGYSYSVGKIAPLIITEVSADGTITFYGAVLSAIATACLGAFALWQNQRFKEENDKSQDRIERMNEQLMLLQFNQENQQMYELFIFYTEQVADLLTFLVEMVNNNKRQNVKKCNLFENSLNKIKFKILLFYPDIENDEYFQYVDDLLNVAYDNAKSLDKKTRGIDEYNTETKKFLEKAKKSVYGDNPTKQEILSNLNKIQNEKENPHD